MSYITNLSRVASENTNFRVVVHTTKKSQLVVMNIPVGGEIGEEKHAHVEQILSLQSGTGKTVLDGKETVVNVGDVIVVPPGTKHNLTNVGTVPLVITTIYVPPNHLDGRVHATKEEADADHADEAFGAAVA